MADEKEAGGGQEVQAKKPGNKGLLLMFLVLSVALGGGAFAYLSFFSGDKHEAGAKEKKPVKSALIALDPFVLNLAEHGRFLKVSMQLEIEDGSQAALVNEKIPQLRDAIITLVSSKSAESVSSPEGKFQLKDELLLRANQAVGGGVVFKNLYFTEFVMQ